jgi:predicted Fe-Mo cluster-binding NifX family protein
MSRPRLMKTAFADWDRRIAPVFDTAGQIHVVETKSGEITGEMQEVLLEESPVQKALRLAELGVETLVCGAISRTLSAVISGYDIRIIPFVAGDLREVIQAWLRGGLESDSFSMPGCCRLGSRQFRGRHSHNQEVITMNGRGRGRGAGGGRGLGQRGSGRRRSDDFMTTGPGGHCVCPQCGQTESHQPGVPCIKRKCPKCGAVMIRQ